MMIFPVHAVSFLSGMYCSFIQAKSNLLIEPYESKKSFFWLEYFNLRNILFIIVI